MFYSQANPEYKKIPLGTGVTLFSHGCFLVSIANLAKVDPVKLLGEAKRTPYGITKEGLLYPATVAKLADMVYIGKFKKKPVGTCVAVTDHYKNKGIPQHFFVLLENGLILDPLDFPCVPRENNYKIVEDRKSVV
jgi:hypothetical protein